MRFLLRVGLRVEELLLELLFCLSDLAQAGGGAVRDVKAAAAGVVGVEDGECGRRIVEVQTAEIRHGADLFKERDNRFQPLQIPLDLEQLDMVGRLQLAAAAQRASDVLDLAEGDHDLVIGFLQLSRGLRSAVDVIQLRLQLRALLRRIKSQPADALAAEGTAAVQALQNILQADFFSLLETNADHVSSSFTLMTGTSTASCSRARNSSLSNFQP